MKLNWPKVTVEMIAEAELKRSARLLPVTLCQCFNQYYGFRLGCKCGGKIEWLVKTMDGRYLRPNIDVSIIESSQA